VSSSLSWSLSAGIGSVCRLSHSQTLGRHQTRLGRVCPLASNCSENRGLLVAQALLRMIAKLAHQAKFWLFVIKL